MTRNDREAALSRDIQEMEHVASVSASYSQRIHELTELLASLDLTKPATFIAWEKRRDALLNPPTRARK